MKPQITSCLIFFLLFSLLLSPFSLFAQKTTTTENEFTKTVSEKLASLQALLDSVNGALQADKDVQFYNEFQSQFKPFFDANAETDAFAVQTAKAVDSLQQFVNSKLIKGKVDPKEMDAFIYISSNSLKSIVANYTK